MATERKEITLRDCLDLKTEFDKYCETAEQHQFPILAMVNIRMDNTLAGLKQRGRVENQKDIRAMFRVVLKIMGRDFSEYVEQEGEHE